MATAKVTILHRDVPSDSRTLAFISPAAPNDSFEPAYSYRRQLPLGESTDSFLEAIWRENNIVDGDEIPARYSKRSLSVGDVVEIELPWGVRYWAVQPIGWRLVDWTPKGAGR